MCATERDVTIVLYSILEGEDYEIIGGAVSFSANRNQQVGTDCRGLTIELLDDPVVEETEELVIMLQSDQPERIKVSGFANSIQYTSVIIKDSDGEHGSENHMTVM